MTTDPKQIPPPGFVAEKPQQILGHAASAPVPKDHHPGGTRLERIKLPPVGAVFTDRDNPPGPGWRWSDNADPPRWLPPDASSPYFAKAIGDAWYKAQQSSPSPLPHSTNAPDPQGQDRGQGEAGVMPAITDHGVTELVQSAPQPPEQGEGEPTSLQAAATQAIDAMRTTQRLLNLPDGHLLSSAERALDAALRAVEDSEQSSNPLQLPPHQSAAEWVEERIAHVCDDGGTERMIPEDDALELARRCDEAENGVYLALESRHEAWCESDDLRAQLTAEQDNARQSREEIEALKGDIAAIAENQGEWMRRAMAFEDQLAAAQAEAASWKSHAEKLQTALDRAHQAAEVHQADYLQRISAAKEELTRLQHENTAHRAAWQNAEARERELREALERIEKCEDAPDIDATGEWQTGLFCGVEDRDCANRYEGALYGHTVGIEKALEWAVNEARAALAKHKEAQP